MLDLLLLLGLEAGLVQPLGLRRPALKQPYGRKHEQDELQVLRLPVLHHRLPEVRGSQIAAERDSLLAVLQLIVVERRMPGNGRSDERGEEDRPEEKRQR